MPVPVPLKTERPEEGKLNKAKYIPLPDVSTGNTAKTLLPHNQHASTSFGYPGGPLHSDNSQPGHLSRTSMYKGHGSVVGFSNIPTTNLLPGTVPLAPSPSASYIPVQWDWDIEHEDRRRETKADSVLHGAQPFQVDRRVLKDVVREKTNCEVGRITFLSSGTFHKAYLVTLVDTRELVARVARRYMPRLKTQSEIATMRYLREKTSVPVPDVYYYDSNPYNRLGGEYILMSKAPGMPLSRVYHSMSNDEIKILFKNMASIIIPLFAQRFSHIGSLYFDSSSLPTPTATSSVLLASSSSPTPTATHPRLKSFPFMPLISATPTSATNTKSVLPGHMSRTTSVSASGSEIHVGPIVSWPFFGSNRGDLSHPSEIDRGPWRKTRSYLEACVVREITGVKRENEGKSAPHRLHLDPDEIRSSRHHHLDAVPDDQSDDSDEWDAQESEDEWEGPGDCMYRDYRRMQRSTFLVAHIMRREECVRKEMGRWMRVMDRLGAHADHAGAEEFGLDCHDLNLENVFVDGRDHTKITCVIDWESTTTRPLWQCAHLPAVVQSSPFTVKLFREVVAEIANSRSSNHSSQPSLAATAREWLHYEAIGARLRLAHRCAEWDGWEEGLVESILGPEDGEEEWFKDTESAVEDSEAPSVPAYDGCVESEASSSEQSSGALMVSSFKRRKQAGRIPLKKEKEREQMLTTTGDICGGRGGELGRRLEAWLSINGNGRRRDQGEDSQEEYDGGAE
ncbi:hypothetical protein PAXINDRAFT_169135 [Paxillus involutus ATCC 200175]|uniref:Aminoglycoside phosphotransferase domain-containing protein n=1 Tax=Paxillus involutus ATCC 200175 TaxID=664439 RepID=A0A0C9U8D6_PAXIN|nr:hypothetical protein PAXINDRAFT_169135 [Paxillus involutus ATCC 200175]